MGSKAAVWEVKDPLLAQPTGGTDYPDEDTASNYHGGAPASLVGGVSGQQFYNQGQKPYGGPGVPGVPNIPNRGGYPPSDGRY